MGVSRQPGNLCGYAPVAERFWGHDQQNGFSDVGFFDPFVSCHRKPNATGSINKRRKELLCALEA